MVAAGDNSRPTPVTRRWLRRHEGTQTLMGMGSGATTLGCGEQRPRHEFDFILVPNILTILWTIFCVVWNKCNSQVLTIVRNKMLTWKNKIIIVMERNLLIFEQDNIYCKTFGYIAYNRKNSAWNEKFIIVEQYYIYCKTF